MHSLDSISEAGFVALFETAERYIALARQLRTQARYFVVFLNGGPKSASSVEHVHLQVVGRNDSHFGYPETIAARCPGNYWQWLHAIHGRLGLVFGCNDSAGWVCLAPVKEREVTVLCRP